MTDITIYHLEMLSPEQLKPSKASPALEIAECEIRQPLVNRFLYQLVGQHWEWNDRLRWSEAQWQEYVDRDDLRTWLALHRGSPAGFYELEKQPGNTVELKYFGLAKPFIGKGFGGSMLSHALQSAWEWGETERVWVHTCTTDHPDALANYQARGLQLFKTEIEPPESA